MAQEKWKLIGGQLRQGRKRKGLTQHQLAERLGLSRVSISNYETGLQQPLAGNFARLCAELGLTELEVYGTRIPLAEPDRQPDLSPSPSEQLPLAFERKPAMASLRVTRQANRLVLLVELEELA